MGELSELEVIRKKKKRKTFLKRLVILLLVFCAVAGTLIGYKYLGEHDVAGYLSDMINFNSTGEGYPVEFAGNTAKNTFTLSGRLGVLTDTSVHLYDKKGQERGSMQHKYADPVIDVVGSNFLLYDRDGKNLSIRTNKKEVAALSFDDAILYASLSGKGYLVVVTEAEHYIAKVSVYNTSYDKEVFAWYSSANYVLSAELGPDSNTLAVGTVNLENGALVSGVTVFSLGKEEPVAQLKLDESALINLTYKKNGDIYALCDDCLVVLNRSGKEIGRYTFEDRTLVSYNQDMSGNTLLLFGNYLETHSHELVLLDRTGKELKNATIDYRVNGMAVTQQEIYLFNEKDVCRYDTDLTLTARSEQASDLIGVQPVGRALYGITPKDIRFIELESMNQSS